jgi:tetratricopeptide (TPR) repeat protein
MSASFVEGVRLAYRRGDPTEALELSEKVLADFASELSSTDRHELLVLKSHCLSVLGRWDEAIGVLDSAALTGEIAAEAKARLAMHKGYLKGSLARYSECWSFLHQAEQVASELGLQTLLAEVLWRRVHQGDNAL